ncbi:hypothetical protein N5912_00345 [Arcobacter lacus]|uniref:hypothetical protein n=1 Tax=Arcobacter lacus TaxID=1912876 RepID=UPI0021BB3051|nr:hypothetical protein [Arcobacter lacus]MCT7910266.1 hypothetical protein [Arcobacter lacus]
MAKDTGFDGRDIEWHNKGYGRDIDFDKSNENSNKNVVKEINCGSPMGFISSLQEISVQEKLLEGSIDKNLFTIQKTVCAIKNGLSLGFVSSITILFHILFCYLFSYKFVINSFKNNEILGLFIEYLPALITIAVTVYISNLSKYAVGDYTARALKTFYIGKMTSTMAVGFVIFISFIYLEPLLNKISFNTSMIYAKQLFFRDIRTIYYSTITLILMSSFLPFLFYGLRKILFNSSEKSKYDEY